MHKICRTTRSFRRAGMNLRQYRFKSTHGQSKSQGFTWIETLTNFRTSTE
jgi:hypothetical protein